MAKYEHVKFFPAVGRHYTKSRFGLRLMVLGESQYRWPEMPKDSTQATIVAIEGAETRRHFWPRIARLFGEKGAFWDNVLFYNYVQEFVGDAARERPADAMWDKSAEAFKEVLRLHKPDRILVIGKKTWSWMAGDSKHFPIQWPIPEPRFRLPCEQFKNGLAECDHTAYWYPTGRASFALIAPVYHPAYPRGFHRAETGLVVKKLMSSKWKIPPF